jgi:hypothetical protein
MRLSRAFVRVMTQLVQLSQLSEPHVGANLADGTSAIILVMNCYKKDNEREGRSFCPRRKRNTDLIERSQLKALLCASHTGRLTARIKPNFGTGVAVSRCGRSNRRRSCIGCTCWVTLLARGKTGGSDFRMSAGLAMSTFRDADTCGDVGDGTLHDGSWQLEVVRRRMRSRCTLIRT